jgi:NADH-quinone oxidoreductase subunit H
MTAGIDWVDWILLIARVVVVFLGLLIAVMLVIWMERKVVADMQVRIGPNRAGPAGILITLADGIKLFFKEGITPAMADRPVYLLAPLAAMVPAMLAFAVIPFGTGATLFHRHIPFQITDLNVGILWILAMASLAVYGVVLAGWSSGSNYPLLGAIRASAQMISYEVGMSLGLVAVLLYSGTLQMTQIIAVQARHFGVPGLGWLPKWNLFLQFPSFVIYMTAALAETSRPPFDLPEAETELVAGHHTEYSGIDVVPWLWPLLWFVVKLFVVIYVLIWIRATVPRFRYDRLMALGWKVLIPAGLLWILITAAAIELPNIYSDGRAALIIAAGSVAIITLLLPLFVGPPRAAGGIDQARRQAGHR